jgi:hypothetical protein
MSTFDRMKKKISVWDTLMATVPAGCPTIWSLLSCMKTQLSISEANLGI